MAHQHSSALSVHPPRRLDLRYDYCPGWQRYQLDQRRQRRTDGFAAGAQNTLHNPAGIRQTHDLAAVVDANQNSATSRIGEGNQALDDAGVVFFLELGVLSPAGCQPGSDYSCIYCLLLTIHLAR
jgi:hypothetical protein